MCLPHSQLRQHLRTYPRRSIRHSTRSFSNHKNGNPSTLSTVEVGTSYEHLCLHTLRILGFHLHHTGGRSDRGIDLLGHWVPPSSHSNSPSTTHGRSNGWEAKPLPVIVQCKALAATPTPSIIRELAGAIVGAPEGWRGDDTIGVLCAKREATAGVREAVRRAGMGVVWIMVENPNIGEDGGDGGDGEGDGGRGGPIGGIKQVLWNGRVQRMVGEEVGTGARYVPKLHGRGMEKEICLIWEGRVWLPESEDG